MTRNREKPEKNKCNEEKRKYQAEIKHEKLKLWKEFCNVTASTNPWSQIYKLASGKIRPKSIMTTLTKPDRTETTNIQETLQVLLDYLIEEDTTEENSYQSTIRMAVEEPINTNDDVKFSREEVKEVTESFDNKKTPGIDGVTAGIYLWTF
jgi:hypothetical protein